MTQHTSTAQQPSKSAKDSGSNILIATSDRTHSTLINFIPGERLHISVTRSAEETLHQCQQAPFDLAVIDFDIESSPIELARALHQQFELRSLFLIQDHHLDRLTQNDDVGAIGFLVADLHSQYTPVALQLAATRARELRTLANRESQLITALNSEREINTAIGILMERMHLPRTEAFETLRRYARSQRQQMAQIATKMLQSINDTNELMSLIGSVPGSKAARS